MQIKTGVKCIDDNLKGGIPPGTIALLYGEPETGKTTLALQCAVNCALQNLKVLFVDCENTFSAKRLSQICGDKFDAVAELIVLLKPKDFKEQTALIDGIQDYLTKNVGLVIIDTFTSLYSVKVAQTSAKAFSVNRELNRQMAILAQVAKIQKVPILLTSQVRSIIGEQDSGVRPVATRVVKFWAETIIALKPTDYPQTILATIEKAPQVTREVTCYVQIGVNGIQDSQLH